jgi:hypothetical protein
MPRCTYLRRRTTHARLRWLATLCVLLALLCMHGRGLVIDLPHHPTDVKRVTDSFLCWLLLPVSASHRRRCRLLHPLPPPSRRRRRRSTARHRCPPPPPLLVAPPPQTTPPPFFRAARRTARLTVRHSGETDPDRHTRRPPHDDGKRITEVRALLPLLQVFQRRLRQLRRARTLLDR